MENAYLYFYSAFPQCISALIALIGAFHIFRNDATNLSLYGLTQNVYDIVGHLPIFGNLINNIKQAMISRKLNDIEQCLDTTVYHVNQRINQIQENLRLQNNPNAVIPPEFYQLSNIVIIIGHFKAVKRTRNLRNKKFKEVLTFSMIIVVSSLTILTLNPIVSNLRNQYVAIILFIATILTVIYNLYQIRGYIFVANE